MSKQIAEIISLKNEYGHFTIGYYMGDKPDLNNLPEYVRIDKNTWDNPQDPIVYQISSADGFAGETIKWMLSNTGIEL